ncbi:hypothetical protein TCDM_05106 [Trypanosoma cruzi Dm28c]|uniref:Uncharacterized protein n=1 Tax=Trypanosoma cruzi Dm28c TaxID=1416333 RepID=V5DFM9_TRYCR|nr:hypothetical protein TCDM_05106 [Trypanosoma cruzi Dm28c]
MFALEELSLQAFLSFPFPFLSFPPSLFLGVLLKSLRAAANVYFACFFFRGGMPCDMETTNDTTLTLAQPATSTWCQGLAPFAREEAKRPLFML